MELQKDEILVELWVELMVLCWAKKKEVARAVWLVSWTAVPKVAVSGGTTAVEREEHLAAVLVDYSASLLVACWAY